MNQRTRTSLSKYVLSWILILVMLCSFTLPSFAWAQDTAEEEGNSSMYLAALTPKQQEVVDLADKVLAKELHGRYLGTLYTPYNEEDQPWFNVWDTALRYKNKAVSLSDRECESAIKEITTFDRIYGFDISHKLTEDGYYEGDANAVTAYDVKKVGGGLTSLQSIYDTLETKNEKADVIFNKIEVVKMGNNYEVTLRFPEKRVRDAKFASFNYLLGHPIISSVVDQEGVYGGNGFNSGLRFTIPAELKAEEIVLERFGYYDSYTFENTSLGPVAIQIDWENLTKKANQDADDKVHNALVKEAPNYLARARELYNSFNNEASKKKYGRDKVERMQKLLDDLETTLQDQTLSFDKLNEAIVGFELIVNQASMIKTLYDKLDLAKYPVGGPFTKESEEELSSYLKTVEEKMTSMSLKELVEATNRVNNSNYGILRTDTSELEKKITEGKTYKQANYEPISFGKLALVLHDAQEYVDKEKVYRQTDNQVKEYIKGIDEAIKGLKKNGNPQPEPQPADKTVLNNAIQAAEKVEQVAVSVDGKNIEKNKKWTTKEALDAFKDAISAAKTVQKNDDADKDAIDQAVVDLNKAVETYIKAQKPGLKEEAPIPLPNEEKTYTANVYFLKDGGIQLSHASHNLWAKAKLTLDKNGAMLTLKLLPGVDKEGKYNSYVSNLYYQKNGVKTAAEIVEKKSVKIGNKEYQYPETVRLPIDVSKGGDMIKMDIDTEAMVPSMGNDPHEHAADLLIDFANKYEGASDEDWTVNKNELNAIVYEAMIGKSNLTPKQQEKLAKVLDEAKATLNNPKANASQVEKAFKALDDKIAALNEENKLRSALKQAEASYVSDEKTGNFTKESMAAVKKVIDDAKKEVEKDLDVTTIKELAKRVNDAYLLARFNTQALQDTLKEAKEMVKKEGIKADQKEALEKAINDAEAFVKKAKDTRSIQDAREALKEALENAMKNVDNPLIVEKDKTFSVPVKLVKENKNTPSMAADTLKANAEVVQKADGTSVYTLAFKPKEMDGAKGRIVKMLVREKLEDGDYTAAQKSNKAGEVYDTIFTFTRQNKEEQRIRIQVSIDSPKMDQDADLLFDWAKATEIKDKPEPQPQPQPEEIDKTKLMAAIKTAKAVPMAKVSEDGKDIAKNRKWTTQDVLDAFKKAIKDAEAVADNKDAEKADVEKAVADLNKAIAAYKDAQQNGKKPQKAGSGGSSGGGGMITPPDNKKIKPEKDKKDKEKLQPKDEQKQDEKKQDEKKRVSYMAGYPDGTFKPNKDMTRAEVAAMLAKLIPDNTGTMKKAFSDVNGSDWFAEPINKLTALGIISGYADGSFKPNAPITRAEYVSMIAQFKKVKSNTQAFNDVKGHWAAQAISAAKENGWTSGYPDGSFKPQNHLTRAEAVAMSNRIFELKGDKDVQTKIANKEMPFKDIGVNDWFYKEVLIAS